MSEPGFVSGSIGELLAAIASGVRDAQAALSSAPPLDDFGRPAPTYHLPYVDFEFKVDIETRSSGGGVLKPLLLARPLSDSTRSITSSVSGRLVAIPPGEGRPVAVLALTATKSSPRQHHVMVTATSSAGEILAGETVELNLDADASRQLSGPNWAAGGLGDTNVASALLTTNAEGRADTVLTISNDVPNGAIVVLTAELGLGVASIALPAESPS